MKVHGDLVYYLDDRPGVARRRRGKGWQYIAADGTSIDQKTERARLNALAVPPAYEDVWLSPLANGHLQATGRDVRKRKQYRYHERWAEAQSANKFARLPEFGEALPRLRRRLLRDLQSDEGDHVFALAAATKLIDKAAVRVGHPEYTEENGSYGAITLKPRHIKFDGDRIKLNYKAKGGKKVKKQIAGRSLGRALQKINDLPGAELFTWIDSSGEARALTSSSLNAYISDATGLDTATAKTFRTWAGTVSAFTVAENGDATIKDMTEAAAQRLHNTPTIARTSYIHPAVIDLAGCAPIGKETKKRSGLKAVESRLLTFLDSQ